MKDRTKFEFSGTWKDKTNYILEKLVVVHLVNKSHAFMKPQTLLLWLQQPDTKCYIEEDKTVQHPYHLFVLEFNNSHKLSVANFHPHKLFI
jgi:hypothetical protein